MKGLEFQASKQQHNYKIMWLDKTDKLYYTILKPVINHSYWMVTPQLLPVNTGIMYNTYHWSAASWYSDNASWTNKLTKNQINDILEHIDKVNSHTKLNNTNKEEKTTTL